MCLKLLQDSCSEAMIRLFVFFLNFLFIIVGVALACIGIWMEVEYTKIEVCDFFMILPIFTSCPFRPDNDGRPLFTWMTGLVKKSGKLRFSVLKIRF